MISDEPSVEPQGGSDEGGEEACWLHRLCSECGAVLEGQRPRCWRCGTAIGLDGLRDEHTD